MWVSLKRQVGAKLANLIRCQDQATITMMGTCGLGVRREHRPGGLHARGHTCPSGSGERRWRQEGEPRGLEGGAFPPLGFRLAAQPGRENECLWFRPPGVRQPGKPTQQTPTWECSPPLTPHSSPPWGHTPSHPISLLGPEHPLGQMQLTLPFGTWCRQSGWRCCWYRGCGPLKGKSSHSWPLHPHTNSLRSSTPTEPISQMDTMAETILKSQGLGFQEAFFSLLSHARCWAVEGLEIWGAPFEQRVEAPYRDGTQDIF